MTRAAPYDRDVALDAALTVFWDKGFHATSLKDLEAALRMKPGSIYAAFSSKEKLYLLALERYFERSRANFRDQVAQAPSPLAALADYFRSFARLAPNDASRQACMLTKTMVDTRTTDPAIAAATQRYLNAMQAEFAVAFAAAQKVGELTDSADPDRLARRFQANVTALRLAAHHGMTLPDFTELAEDMATEIEQMQISAAS